MILVYVLYVYYKDCKEIGKDDLAVPLSERLEAYLLLVIVPILLGILKAKEG